MIATRISLISINSCITRLLDLKSGFTHLDSRGTSCSVILQENGT